MSWKKVELTTYYTATSQNNPFTPEELGLAEAFVVSDFFYKKNWEVVTGALPVFQWVEILWLKTAGTIKEGTTYSLSWFKEWERRNYRVSD